MELRELLHATTESLFGSGRASDPLLWGWRTVSAKCSAKPAIPSALTEVFQPLITTFILVCTPSRIVRPFWGAEIIILFEKEALLAYIMTILHFLITFHPFPSLTPPKILFAFLIRLVHQGDAFREPAVTVPRSFSRLNQLIYTSRNKMNFFLQCVQLLPVFIGERGGD